jgi:hypothetical protein
MSADNHRPTTEGPPGPFVVVGLHRVALFPAENLGGSHRWVVVVENESGDWYRRVTPGGCRPRIRIGEQIP